MQIVRAGKRVSRPAVINAALWHCRDTPAYKPYFPDVRVGWRRPQQRLGLHFYSNKHEIQNALSH